MSITLELDSTLHIQAERVAQAAGLSVSEWIMNLLRNQILQEFPRDLTTVQDPLREGLFDMATDFAETSEDWLQRKMILSSLDNLTVTEDPLEQGQPADHPLLKLAGIAQGTGEPVGRDHNRYLYGRLNP